MKSRRYSAAKTLSRCQSGIKLPASDYTTYIVEAHAHLDKRRSIPALSEHTQAARGYELFLLPTCQNEGFIQVTFAVDLPDAMQAFTPRAPYHDIIDASRPHPLTPSVPLINVESKFSSLFLALLTMLISCRRKFVS